MGPLRARSAPLLRGAVIAALALAVGVLTGGAAQPSLEYPVKATYLYKFAPFVDWPAGAFTSTGAPFTICVAGADPFGPLLDQIVGNQRVYQRPIVVRRMAKVEAGAPCQILYLGGGKAQSTGDALAAVRGAPILTVTDSALRTGGAKGVIDFVVKDNRVRFEIDDQAAAANGLNISSKLLSLAVAVKPKG